MNVTGLTFTITGFCLPSALRWFKQQDLPPHACRAAFPPERTGTDWRYRLPDSYLGSYYYHRCCRARRFCHAFTTRFQLLFVTPVVLPVRTYYVLPRFWFVRDSVLHTRARCRSAPEQDCNSSGEPAPFPVTPYCLVLPAATCWLITDALAPPAVHVYALLPRLLPITWFVPCTLPDSSGRPCSWRARRCRGLTNCRLGFYRVTLPCPRFTYLPTCAAAVRP